MTCFADLDPFFERSLLYIGDMDLDCDPDWLIQLFVEKVKPAKVQKAFVWAHRKVCRLVFPYVFYGLTLCFSAHGIAPLQLAPFGETSYFAVVRLQIGSFPPSFGCFEISFVITPYSLITTSHHRGMIAAKLDIGHITFRCSSVRSLMKTHIEYTRLELNTFQT
jgi:hypothetical protein